MLDVRLSWRTGTLEAQYRTTIGGWIPAGMSARMKFVAATICAIGRSRLASRSSARLAIQWFPGCDLART